MHIYLYRVYTRYNWRTQFAATFGYTILIKSKKYVFKQNHSSRRASNERPYRFCSFIEFCLYNDLQYKSIWIRSGMWSLFYAKLSSRPKFSIFNFQLKRKLKSSNTNTCPDYFPKGRDWTGVRGFWCLLSYPR